MVSAELEELLNKNIIICERIEKRAKIIGNGAFALSLLDVLFGLLAIFCTTLQLTSLIASISSLTFITIGNRIIQVSKIRQVEKALRTADVIALTWFANKYKKYLKEKKKMVKQTKSTVLQKVLTTILAVFGVGGIVVGVFPAFMNVSQYVTNIIAGISEGIAVVSGIWLSVTNDKVLTAEEIAKAEEDEKSKRKAKAQAIVDKYENAKRILEQ